METRDSLTYPPRGLNREEAARYVGIGTSLFDRLVEEGRMPKPKHIGKRVVWDRLKLDAKTLALVRLAALIAVGHTLQVHQFLVIRAIVAHNEQHRNAVMRCRPECARRVHHVAVVLHFYEQSPVLAVRQRGAHT